MKYHPYCHTSPLLIQVTLCSFQMKLHPYLRFLPLKSDLLGPSRPSETMPSHVLWFLPNLRLQFLPPQKWFARTFKTFRDYVLACGFYHTFACSFYASQKWFTSAFETMPSPVVSTTTSPVVSTLVYRARPLLSLTGSWGRSVGKAREGLADVISMHEMLT